LWFDDYNITFNSGGLEKPDQLDMNSYYVHGGKMPNMCYSSSYGYKYGYQGQFAEKDEESNETFFELRNYDPILGKFNTIDPYGQYFSPYMAMGNSHPNMVDEDGGFSKRNLGIGGAGAALGALAGGVSGGINLAFQGLGLTGGPAGSSASGNNKMQDEFSKKSLDFDGEDYDADEFENPKNEHQADEPKFIKLFSTKKLFKRNKNFKGITIKLQIGVHVYRSRWEDLDYQDNSDGGSFLFATHIGEGERIHHVGTSPPGSINDWIGRFHFSSFGRSKSKGGLRYWMKGNGLVYIYQPHGNVTVHVQRKVTDKIWRRRKLKLIRN
jgi:RHS repeat-associated protein